MLNFRLLLLAYWSCWQCLILIIVFIQAGSFAKLLLLIINYLPTSFVTRASTLYQLLIIFTFNFFLLLLLLKLLLRFFINFYNFLLLLLLVFIFLLEVREGFEVEEAVPIALFIFLLKDKITCLFLSFFELIFLVLAHKLGHRTVKRPHISWHQFPIPKNLLQKLFLTLLTNKPALNP